MISNQKQMKLYLTCVFKNFMTQSFHRENVAAYSSACSISVYCELTRLPYTCQKLSLWHLAKNIIYWLKESGCSHHTADRHFPTTFWELRLGVISDVVIAKSPRAPELQSKPQFLVLVSKIQSVYRQCHKVYGIHQSVSNDQYYL